MPYLALTLSGYPVDLPADAQVALSYRVNDVRSLESREAAFSETFTLPLTAQNRQVLGNPHDLASLTTTPYRLLPAVLTSPGGAVLLNGYGIVEGSGEGYEVTLTDAAGALFAVVGNRGLRELDLSSYDHPLTLADLQAADANDTGYTYALFDTGVLAGRPVNFDLTPDELPASVFVRTLLEAMLRDPLPPSPLPAGYQPVANPLAGYRFTGSLLADPLFQAEVVPRATAYPQLRAQYLYPYAIKAAQVGDYTYNDAAPTRALSFQRRISGGATLTNGYYYTPPPHAIGLRFKARLPVVHSGGGCFIRLLQQEGNQTPVELYGYPLNLNSGSRLVSFDVTFPVVAATVQTRFLLDVAILPTYGTTVLVKAGASLEITPAPRAWAGAPVHLDAGLPDKSQADLLKLLFSQYNVIVQADPVTRTLRLDLFNDVERNRARAVDWTHLLDFTRRPRLAHRLPDYAQTNTLAYAELPELVLEEVVPDTDAATGQGALLVTDATLPATREALAAGLTLPLEHLTGFGSLPLLWVPFFVLADPAKAAPLFDSQHAYSKDDLAIYKGQTFKCLAATGATIQSTPLWGENRLHSNTYDWEVTADAWPVKNEELPTIARLVPNTVVRVLDYGQHGAAYVPSRQLSRAGLAFADLLPAYYPTLAECFRRVLLLTVDMRLGGLDIANLDFTVPRKLGPLDVPGYGRLACLGYLNLIDQWQPGQPGAVEVQLLVLGAPVPGLAPAVPMPMPQQLRAFVDELNQYYLLSEDGQYLLPE